jgi:hypothetical protein
VCESRADRVRLARTLPPPAAPAQVDDDDDDDDGGGGGGGGVVIDRESLKKLLAAPRGPEPRGKVRARARARDARPRRADERDTDQTARPP